MKRKSKRKTAETGQETKIRKKEVIKQEHGRLKAMGKNIAKTSAV